MNILLLDLFYLIPDFFFITFITVILLIAVINKNFYNAREILKSVTELSLVGLTFLVILNLAKINISEVDFTSNFLLQENLHTNVIKLILLIISLLIFIISKYFYESRNTLPFEVPIILLFSLFGISVVITTTDLMLLYLALELQSLSIYALVASRYNSNISTEAALKYFILGSFISGFILYAISLIYFITGTTSLTNLNLYLLNNNSSYILLLALILLTGGFLFKLSAAPFHNWTPDVFEGAPTIVTLFISTIPKLAILYVIINVYYIACINLVELWSHLFLLAGVCSLVIGTLGGLYQTKIKRLLAFSTINNMGYILLALSLASKESIESTLFYLIIYILLNTGIFSIIISVVKEKSNRELVYINDLNLISQKSILLTLVFTLIFSLIGVPPLIGFFSKFYILSLMIQQNLIFFAIIAVITSVISTFYYIRLIKILYIKRSNNTEDLKFISESIIFIIYIITCLNLLLSFNIDYILKILHLISLSIYI